MIDARQRRRLLLLRGQVSYACVEGLERVGVLWTTSNHTRGRGVACRCPTGPAGWLLARTSSGNSEKLVHQKLDSVTSRCGSGCCCIKWATGGHTNGCLNACASPKHKPLPDLHRSWEDDSYLNDAICPTIRTGDPGGGGGGGIVRRTSSSGASLEGLPKTQSYVYPGGGLTVRALHGLQAWKGV